MPSLCLFYTCHIPVLSSTLYNSWENNHHECKDLLCVLEAWLDAINPLERPRDNNMSFVGKWIRVIYLIYDIHMNGHVIWHSYTRYMTGKNFLQVPDVRYRYWYVIWSWYTGPSLPRPPSSVHVRHPVTAMKIVKWTCTIIMISWTKMIRQDSSYCWSWTNSSILE